uniref:Chitinase domain-containing protein 1 n=1 Tax=Meloidogyne javanica TaxID=6303 RepID=A0A915MV18_MELJA
AAQKFTHISPVWFQLKSAGSPIEDAPLFCQITGTHDIDSGWMDDIRKNNSKVKIVPRFLFEAWPVEDLKKFLYSEEVQRRCVKDIVRLLQRNQMDGAVIEIWVQIMSMTRGSAVEYLLEIIESWSKEFHKVGLEFILPMMPALDANYEETGIVNREVMKRLMSSVDYLNVMTYDYNKDYLESSTKILMGLNFYGYDRSGSSSEAVLSKKFIEILSDGDSVLSFDENDGEHKLIFGKYGIIYYPTKQSIKLRLNLAIELGIGGVAIWDLGQGLNHFTSVL